MSMFSGCPVCWVDNIGIMAVQQIDWNCPYTTECLLSVCCLTIDVLHIAFLKVVGVEFMDE